MARIGKTIQHNGQFKENEASLASLMQRFAGVGEIVKLGGGKAAAEKQRKKGKLGARERIQKLIDGSKFFVLDAAHLSNIEQPDAFNGTVLEFLTQ